MCRDRYRWTLVDIVIAVVVIAAVVGLHWWIVNNPVELRMKHATWCK